MVALLMFLQMSCCAPIPKEPRPDDKCPGYMGVQFEEVDGGILIRETYADSPAQRAGLQPSDIIVKISGKAPGSLRSVQRSIYYTAPNTIVPLEVKRGDKTVKLKLRVGFRPENFGYAPPPLEDEDDSQNEK